uniref:N-acetyltransferase domain-containing protein n=1 Tax=Sus scrofa TaxID=9823 RepID=A0A8D1IDM4_PIG
MKVQSFGERIVLFILNVVIFGRLERNLDDDDMFFLPHSVKEEAKILWRDGAAVGFYTIKMKGSLCGDGTSACYLLPVFDTVFVRRSHRRQGLGLAMLQDFCQTFREDEALGISWPISPAMYQVHLENPTEDVTSHGQTSQDDGPRRSTIGEDDQERISGEELENDGDSARKEAVGWGMEAKRTAEDAGLPGGSWQKHTRPSS